MTRRVAIVVVSVFLVLVAAGFVFTYLPKARLAANFAASQNNLRALALFAAHHSNPDPKRDARKLPTEIPPGTIFLADVPVDHRLSWVVDVLPGLDQKKQNTEALLASIDRTKPWTAEPNQTAGMTRLVVLLCPENPPEVGADAPGVTSYVGIGGVGADAAALPLGSPRSGAFRYDGPTPFDRITDGLSQTLLFGETRYEVGPWLRGGPSTVRGLNDAPGAPPLVGGQFGGYFPSGVNFAMCDGGVRTFSPQTAPKVLLNLATIAGKETDPVPGE
jgi:hypothetical protein